MGQKLYTQLFGDGDGDEFLLWGWGWDHDTRTRPAPLPSLLVTILSLLKYWLKYLFSPNFRQIFLNKSNFGFVFK